MALHAPLRPLGPADPLGQITEKAVIPRPHPSAHLNGTLAGFSSKGLENMETALKS